MMQKLLAAMLCAVLGAFIATPVFATEELVSADTDGVDSDAGGVDAEIQSIEEDESPISANVSLVSNYLYRGISQSGGKPAIQGGFDYEHSSGFYVGVFGTSISFLGDLYTETAGKEGANNASLELDTYVGFKRSFADDFSYDVGFLRYNYPGTYAPGATKADTDEVYGGVGYKWISAKYSYSLGNTFANANTRGTNYLELNANYPFEQVGITLGAHYGKQTYQGAGAILNGNSLTYSDYKLGVTKEIGDFELGLAYSNTNATAAYTILGRNIGQGTAVLSVSRLF